MFLEALEIAVFPPIKKTFPGLDIGGAGLGGDWGGWR